MSYHHICAEILRNHILIPIFSVLTKFTGISSKAAIAAAAPAA
jgi:hypothetical protein